MKKIFAIFLTICLMAGMLCTTAFAAGDSEGGTVLGIRMQEKDGDILSFGEYSYFDSFDDGWNEAIGLALDEEFMEKNEYERVVVDIYADLTADDGWFTDDYLQGEGFSKHTIYVPEDVKVTLNLNGHTIDRAMTDWDSAGHVIYVDEGADLIINDGTITGGWSSSNAGCIHVPYKANVTLNNVNIVGNTADDADGGGIALYGGSTLTMNGGSFRDNFLTGWTTGDCGGALYVDKSTAILNGVEFKNNISDFDDTYGTAIYAINSNVTMDNCTFEGNGLNPSRDVYYQSIIYSKYSTLTVKNSTFKNNRAGSLFSLYDTTLTTIASEFTGSTDTDYFVRVISGCDASLYFTDTNFTDNEACVIRTDSSGLSEDSFFRNCTFKNTKDAGGVAFANYYSPITFYDCDMDDTVINTTIKMINSTVPEGVAAIGVRGMLADGTVAFAEYYGGIDYGWTYAIKTAMTNEYDRIVVDLYEDWLAYDDGQFTKSFYNDAGFNWDAIHIPENVRITINLNGHKIDRHLADTEKNGEVMHIDTNADVIISDGTITGGHSNNGAGGIHINDGANVTLNNVSVSGNIVENDDGAAIAVYDGATLTMNGGKIENNLVFNTEFFFGHSYGAIYLSDASAVLNGVEILHNRLSGYHTSRGVAIYLDDSNLVMKNCNVTDNGHKETVGADSIICVEGSASTLDITGCKFENNGTPGYVGAVLIDIDEGTLKMKDSYCINNSSSRVLSCDDALIDVTNTHFEGNIATVFFGTATGESKFDSCTFVNNNTSNKYYIFYFEEGNQLEFTNCDLGDSSFNDRSRATFNGKAVGSIFGEGSLTMIVALVALVAAGAAIFVSISVKKSVAAAPKDDDAEAEDAEAEETTEE